MKAKIAKGKDKLFTPEFHTAIGGKSVRLTREELINNWPKYIYTPAASVYGNLKELREKFKSVKKAEVESVVLDMSKAKTRGKIFDQPTKKQALAKKLEAFKAEQFRKRARLEKKHEAQKKREKDAAAKARKAVNDKNSKAAKKAKEEAKAKA